MGSDWQGYIPTEVLSEIFKYLTKYDKLSCSLVCQKWKEALDRRNLWKKINIRVDHDFLEPSTTALMQDYLRHIEHLEFGWEKPLVQNRWLPLKVHELTKRVVRYLFSLIENDVQLVCFKIFEWHDLYPFKKIIYHLCRFLKSQKKLKILIFRNANLPRTECLKVLEACSVSKNTLKSLEIRNNSYSFDTAFEGPDFLFFLKDFAFLEELKLDYFILSRERVIDILAESGQEHLCHLELFFDKSDLESIIIPERKWRKLKELCPNLKVSITIKDVCHYEQIEFIFLMENIPLSSFSLITNSKYNQRRSREFERTLVRLIDNYQESLECVRLELKNNRENLDHLLLNIILKCSKLKRLLFDGIVADDMYLFHEICVHQQSASGLQCKLLSITHIKAYLKILECDTFN
ncbi:hypothetical protein JTB14_001654 [Gonioctena quinquepunctata]|nr:hypothetical protein JTB14_001654 [Gonioctena quinquepunctata]